MSGYNPENREAYEQANAVASTELAASEGTDKNFGSELFIKADDKPLVEVHRVFVDSPELRQMVPELINHFKELGEFEDLEIAYAVYQAVLDGLPQLPRADEADGDDEASHIIKIKRETLQDRVGFYAEFISESRKGSLVAYTADQVTRFRRASDSLPHISVDESN